ncbi:MAG: response regulator [Oryzomonas sp.]|uniref:response regulator n=1 Tax=Oryzomonas sp. TaxID=2855186 RepID=UPI002843A4AC|nr:response regulator [Oryzomonas sp.]MDR3580685.1 response regulator [Oryzomonas sp.]
MQSILVVDDIAENLYFLEVLLKGNGYEMRSAQNGAEALESARENPPDLIVSDILMPVMDGYALCREWLADEGLKHIPFIFYTATFTDKKDEALALNLGADRFVIKPQEPETLLGIIREVLDASSSDTLSDSADLPEYEGKVLKEYNEALFRKLEKKMVDLERTNQELQQTLLEQKRLEEQLRQVQKLEALGRFSAGIAHDFNNILTVISGFGSMMQMTMPANDPQRDRLDHILAAAERAKDLTRSLLTFCRKQEMKLSQLNLNDRIRNVEIFLRRIIGEDIKLIIALREEMLPIFADGGQIEQVLMNLATNARDAMPDGGILSIGTDIIEIDNVFIQMHGYGTLGRNAILTVADTGVGMDEETRQQIFDPFFTTKEIDKGTGLGLSIIYGIIQQHKGHISVYSEPGQGTTFRILLPFIEGKVSLQNGGVHHPSLQRGHETILVVDDDAAIREYLSMFLTSLGYRVLLAEDGQKAVEIFRNMLNDVDLVLIDVMMPNKKGSEAAREIRNIREDIKIVFTSGYPYDLIHDQLLLEEGMQLLLKPLSPTELAKILRTRLDGGIAQ